MGQDKPVDEPLRWSPDPELTPFEVLMWRAEADPTLRSTVLVLELLDTAPEPGRFLAAHEWASRMVPRLRERIEVPLLGLGTPHWAVDPGFDLHYHVRRVRLPAPGGMAELLALAEQTTMTPLDPSRPQWEATLVEGLDAVGAGDGGAAYLFKTSHVLSDGMGLAQLISGLHSRRRDHDPSKPQPAPPSAAADPPGRWLVRQLRRDAGLVRDATVGGLGLLGELRDPASAARGTVEWIASARRVIAPPSSPSLAALSGRSRAWRLRTLDLDFATLRAAGRAAGGSVNDAYLAGLLGGFRRYAEARGELLEPERLMPVTVPVSVRGDDDPAGGNRFAPGRLEAPVGLVDPVARMRAVSAVMGRVRTEPALGVLDVVTPVLSRIPGTVLSALGGGAATGSDLQASNIPGLREEVFLAGARVEGIYPYAPLPGCAAMITMMTHGDRICVAANLDAAAITEIPEFLACLEQGFDEVLDLARA